jgi:hypothetical protein
MEGGSVGHNFERDPPKDHPCQVWFNLVQRSHRRRDLNVKVYDVRRMPSELKIKILGIKIGSILTPNILKMVKTCCIQRIL